MRDFLKKVLAAGLTVVLLTLAPGLACYQAMAATVMAENTSVQARFYASPRIQAQTSQPQINLVDSIATINAGHPSLPTSAISDAGPHFAQSPITNARTPDTIADTASVKQRPNRGSSSAQGPALSGASRFVGAREIIQTAQNSFNSAVDPKNVDPRTDLNRTFDHAGGKSELVPISLPHRFFSKAAKTGLRRLGAAAAAAVAFVPSAALGANATSSGHATGSILICVIPLLTAVVGAILGALWEKRHKKLSRDAPKALPESESNRVDVYSIDQDHKSFVPASESNPEKGSQVRVHLDLTNVTGEKNAEFFWRFIRIDRPGGLDDMGLGNVIVRVFLKKVIDGRDDAQVLLAQWKHDTSEVIDLNRKRDFQWAADFSERLLELGVPEEMEDALRNEILGQLQDKGTLRLIMFPKLFEFAALPKNLEFAPGIEAFIIERAAGNPQEEARLRTMARKVHHDLDEGISPMQWKFEKDGTLPLLGGLGLGIAAIVGILYGLQGHLHLSPEDIEKIGMLTLLFGLPARVFAGFFIRMGKVGIKSYRVRRWINPFSLALGISVFAGLGISLIYLLNRFLSFH